MKKLASLAFSFLFIATAVMDQDAPKYYKKDIQIRTSLDN